MQRLLLVSSSKVHGSGYLEHCEAQILELFAPIDKVLFVPYALFDRDAYARQARQRFRSMGLSSNRFMRRRTRSRPSTKPKGSSSEEETASGS